MVIQNNSCKDHLNLKQYRNPEYCYYLFEHRHHKFDYFVVQLIIPNKRCQEEQSTENAIILIGCIFLPVYHRHLYPNSLVLVHAYTGEKIRKKYVAILQQNSFREITILLEILEFLTFCFTYLVKNSVRKSNLVTKTLRRKGCL